MTMTQENRKFQRISVNRSAKLKIADQECHAKLLDISLCGSGLLCNESIPVDQLVTLLFSLPNHDSDNPLAIPAKVSRIASVQNQFLVGIEFATLDLHEDLVIKGFISYHERFKQKI
ncbi:MAG: hypothetical protein ISEC1_P0881 [Thiomicrorhabdus sp.]|nr:MAG: hypothetical protein ISEC1_P0881 [Thiomicrorhabdus sp.]